MAAERRRGSNRGRAAIDWDEAFLFYVSLPPEQREVWRTIFDHYVFCAHRDPGEHLPQHARGILGPATPALLSRMRMTEEGRTGAGGGWRYVGGSEDALPPACGKGRG